MPFTEIHRAVEPLAKTIIPMEVIAVDMDHDGDLDAVLISYSNPAIAATPIRVMINDGQGNFTENTKAVISGAVPELTLPRQTLVADFNGDGRPDFFFADHGLDEYPYAGAQNGLMLSGPNGYTNAASNLPQVRDFTHSAATADIDGDGDLDIYVGNTTTSQNPYIMLNDGHGKFTMDTSRLGVAGDVFRGTYTTAVFFDSDGDKDADLFLGWDGTANGSTSRLLINDGKGKFIVTDIKTTKNETFVDAKSFDVNGDGRLDLILSGTNPDYKGGFIRVLVNQGDNKFADETASRIFGGTAENWGYRVTLADVDGDGATDLVVTSGTGQSPVLINDGSGHFAKLPDLISGLNVYDIITPADINNDGVLDFITQRGTGTIVEYLGIKAVAAEVLGTVGNDALMGRDGADALYGETGNDVVTGGAGNDFLRGGDGNDIIFGGSGNDDTHGNQGNDTVSGGLGDDWVVGGKDADLLFGGEGFDVVYGNIGNDTCDGGAGNDWIRGGQDDDVLYGREGDDWMSGDKGNDILTGGSGADLFNFSVGSARDRVTDFSFTEGDRVRIESGVPYTVRYEGSDTLVDLNNGDVMTLVGVHLTGSDWII